MSLAHIITVAAGLSMSTSVSDMPDLAKQISTPRCIPDTTFSFDPVLPELHQKGAIVHRLEPGNIVIFQSDADAMAKGSAYSFLKKYAGNDDYRTDNNAQTGYDHAVGIYGRVTRCGTGV